jgi:phospholipase/carboxylesterase
MQIDTITIEPESPATASVIFLHGLGANGHDFEPLVPRWQAQLAVPTRFILPHAPAQPITVNNGYVMPAWYDIAGVNLTDREDAVGIKRSATLINSLIETQIQQGISSQRIILAGFSQGGAMALYTGLRFAKPLAGMLALSCYLPLIDSTQAEAQPQNQSTPIFMAHGRFDPLVNMNWALYSQEYLNKHGYQVTWRDYPVEHAVCEQEIEDIGQWMAQVLRESAS